MAIFPYIEIEKTVQVDDRTRISAKKTYLSKGEAAITKVEIDPDGIGFIEVQGNPVKAENWFTDWQYGTSGTKTVSLRVTTNGAPVTVSKTIEVVTAAADKLFSDDADLVAIETDILKYVPEGKNSFKYAHREAQRQMLEWLWKNGYKKTDGTRITKAEVLDIEEVRFWSKYACLRLLFYDMSNVPDDVFEKKGKEFENEEAKWRTQALLKLDFNGDGTVDVVEGADLTTRDLVRE